MRITRRSLERFLLAAAVAAVIHPNMLRAQRRAEKPAELPNGPAKTGFDIRRFSSAGNGWFETFYVKEAEPLGKVLEDGRVASDTRLLVTQTAVGRLALLMDQMAFHHIAQGHTGGRDWMATF